MNNILKALWIVLSETINILRNLQQTKILPYVYVYSSLQWSFNADLQYAFKSDSKEVWGCFLMSGVKIVHFQEIHENPFKSTKTAVLWI